MIMYPVLMCPPGDSGSASLGGEGMLDGERDGTRQLPLQHPKDLAQPRARAAVGDVGEQQRGAIGDLGAEPGAVQLLVHPKLEHAGKMDEELARELLAIDLFGKEPALFSGAQRVPPVLEAAIHEARPVDLVAHAEQKLKEWSEE